MILNYEIRFCSARSDAVLRGVLLSILEDTILYYEIRTTRNDPVLEDAFLNAKIWFCTTRYDAALRDTIP